MSPDQRPETQTAVVDRIVDHTHAVLLVGDDQQELVVDLAELPEKIKAGDWLKLRIEDDRPVEAIIDPAATKETRHRIAAKLAEVRERGRHRN